MDPIKILRRAWQILWSYRTLWVFGLILALTAAGSAGGNGGNNGVQFSGDNNQPNPAPLPEDWREAVRQIFDEINRAWATMLDEGLPGLGISQHELTALLWIGAIFILVMVVLGIVMAIARYVSETAVIRMVDEYEATDTKMSVRQGFRIGWSRTAWRLFLINLIVNIPVILLLIVLGVLGFIIYTVVARNDGGFAAAGVIAGIGAAFIAIFVVVIFSILLGLLRHFFWRVAALENADVGESLRRGFALVRENWKPVGLMWLVMIGLGILWAIVSFIAFILLIPVMLVTAAAGVLVAGIPGLLLVGLFSLFLNGSLPWIAGGAFVLPLFILIAFSPLVLLTAWQQVFTSTVWTLTYREIKALPVRTLETDIGPVGD